MTTISSICSRVCSGGTPKSSESSYYGGAIPWLNTKEIDFNFIESTEKTITEDGLNNSSAKWVEAPCVIVAMYGATAGKVAISNIRLTTNQACCNLNIDPEKADYRFVYYALKNDFTRLSSMANGGAQQNLNVQQIKDFDIPDFSLSEQKKIADILSSLDDKIETNWKINARLEELAQAIFKSWFIDYEPFGGKMPTDWEINKLGNICKCVLGGTPNRANSEFWNGDIPWINSGEVNKFRIFEPSEYITKLGLEKSATKLLPKGTVVLAITGATLGQVSLLEIDTCANQSVVGILESSKMPFTYLYPFINFTITELLKLQTGGAQQHINKQNVESLTIKIPSKRVISQYDSFIRPLYNRIACICFESARLATLRDTLLPKLMSGEIIPE